MVKSLITVFPTSIRPRMRKIKWEELEEIRIRIGWPVELIYSNHNEWLGNYDSMIDRKRLDEMLNYITGYSAFSMEEELKQGYISMEGGHRIGITGHTTYEPLGLGGEPQITNLVDIGGLNIRIAHEKKGCAKELMTYIRHGDSIYNTLIFAAPGVGKTTYLRDAIRIIAMERKCCVIDERSEIAACVHGRPQNDLGMRCDVLDACPKLLGMKMVLRSMSPEVIAVDELGKAEEFTLIEEMCSSGVKVLGTIHAGSKEEVLRNKVVRELLEKGIIERLVQLERLSNGSRKIGVYGGQGEVIWENT